MVPEGEARTRAVLWLLADYDPGMPILTALGYLKAVEAELARRDSGVGPGEADDRLLPRYRGSRGISALVTDMAGVPAVVAKARRGDKNGTAQAIVVELGPGRVGAVEALMAAESLANMYDDNLTM